MPKFKILAGVHREDVTVGKETKSMEFDAKNHPIVESDKPLDRMFVGKFVKVSDKKKASTGVDLAAQQPWNLSDGIHNHRNLISPEEAAVLEEEEENEEEEEASPKLRKAMKETAKHRKEVAKLAKVEPDDDEDDEDEEEPEDEDEEDDEDEDEEEEEEEKAPAKKKAVVKPAKKGTAKASDGEDVTKDFKVAKDNDLTVLKNKEGGFIIKDGKKVLNEEGVPFKRSNQVREFLKAHVTD